MKNILIGFEFEGGVNEHYEAEFKRNLRKLGINSIGDDGSVGIAGEYADILYEDNLTPDQLSALTERPYIRFNSVEFRTRPMPFGVGIEKLDEILNYLYIATQCGIFRTNDTCGLHINFSNTKYRNRQHAHFFCKFAQLFDEHSILNAFKRGRNTYCRPFIQKKRKRTFKESVRRFYVLGGFTKFKYCPDKYRAVTLRSCTNGRIEIRAPGNTNYQLKAEKISNILSDIKQCATKASRYITSKKITSLSPLHVALAGFKDEDDAYRKLRDRRDC